MDKPEMPPKRELKPKAPKWNSPLWYLPLMLLAIWLWQSTISQLSYRTILYSEFKSHLQKGEVVSCVVRQDEVQGEIRPGGAFPAQQKLNAHKLARQCEQPRND
jgi:hypothetical protein